MNAAVPEAPVFFLKPSTAIIRNGESVVIPPISSDVHHEVEMTLLIGTGGKNISLDHALTHVAGYGIGLDMTMRDVQAEAKKKSLPWTLAKGFDTSAPLSEFVSAARVRNPNELDVRLAVNGVARQSSNTRNFIFSVQHLVSYISRFFTLESGDVLFTGTPEGVGPVRSGDRLEATLADGATMLATLTVQVR